MSDSIGFSATGNATIRASVLSLILDGLASRNLPIDQLLEGHIQPGELADPYSEQDLRQ